jgi:uncharacterized delta-60 repeat protein
MKNLLTILICLLTLPVFAQDGTLDSTFGIQGALVINSNVFAQYSSYFNKVGVLQNGNIIQAGVIGNTTDSNILIRCTKPNGLPENNFGTSTNGYLNVGDAFSKTSAQDLLITNDNKILIGGFCREASYTYILLLKLNADGFFDNTFGVNGQAKIPVSIKTVKRLLLQQNGSILVQADTFLYRFTPAGDIDPTFGTVGRLNIGNVNSIAITPTNKIIASESGSAISIKRYSANGVLDSSFATNGQYYYYVPEIYNGGSRTYERYSNLIFKCDSLDGFNFVYQRFVITQINFNTQTEVTLVSQQMQQQGIIDTTQTCAQSIYGNNYNEALHALYQSNGKIISVVTLDMVSDMVYTYRSYQQLCYGNDISFQTNTQQNIDVKNAVLVNDSIIYILGTYTQSGYASQTKLFKIKTSLNNYQPQVPIAKIWVDKAVGTTSTSFSFRDSSEHGPLQRSWVFTPNNVVYLTGNSTSANPVVKFTQNGKYTVKLVVSNIMGTDSVVQNQLIDINV